MKQNLEINNKIYTFSSNRKAICSLASLQNTNEPENLLDELFYALLKKEHNLSRQEVSDLLDIAEEEYGTKQLLDFATALINEDFTQAEEKQKKFKTIEFLNRKKN